MLLDNQSGPIVLDHQNSLLCGGIKRTHRICLRNSVVVRADSIGSIMIALWEKNSGTKVRSCLSEFCLGLDYEKKKIFKY